MFVGGAAMLLEDAREDELETCRRLVGMLERAASLLELVGASLDPRKPFVRVGEELENPELSTSPWSAPATGSTTVRSGR